MQIYIKNQDGSTSSHTLATLRSHLEKSDKHSVIGFCPTPMPSGQYLFTVVENQLHQYPIRLNTNTTLLNYTAFGDDGAKSQRSSNEPPKKIPPENLFTPEEIEKILDEEKKCPYLAEEESYLSLAQQDLLYSGVVVSGLGVSFYYFLTEFILWLVVA